MKHKHSDFINEAETYYFCDSCGKTKTQPEITPQKISGLNIICKACHRNKNINTILNVLDETETT